MKKLVLIISAALVLLVLTMAVLLANLSSVVSYTMGRFINGEVHISGAGFAYKAGSIVFDFKDTQLKGAIEGHVKNWQLSIGLKDGISLSSIIVTDFDVSFAETKGTGRFFSLPRELLEISRGAVTIDKQKFLIDEVKFKNLKMNKPFAFEIAIRNDHLFNAIHAFGEGIYRGIASEAKGQLNVASLNLNQFYHDMQGMADTRGTFTYAKKRFIYDGPFEILNYMLKDPIFSKPFTVARATGQVNYTYADTTMNINLSNAYYKNDPLTLYITFKKDNLARLELLSDFLDIQEVKDNIALERMAKAQHDLLDYVSKGEIKIKKFVYEKTQPFYGEVALRNMVVSVQDKHFNNVEAALSFNDKKMDITGGRGVFKTSTFFNIAGVIPFSNEKDIQVRGSYLFSLKDIPSLFGGGEIEFKNGETEGTIRIEWHRDRGYKINGSAKLHNARVSWKKVAISAKGAFTFNNDEIVFDPLLINSNGNDMVVTGKWNKAFMDFKMKGDLNALHARPFITIPFDISGIASLNMDIHKDDKGIRADGDIVMDNLSFHVPGVIKKDKGVKSKASLNILKGESQTRIERLVYNLDSINLSLKGDIQADKRANLDIVMNAPGIERVAQLFLFDGNTMKGDMELNLSLRNLDFPLKKLPHIQGYAKISRGSVKLPWIKQTLREISLVSNFKGETFDIKMDSLKCGTSIVNEGTLRIEGIEKPRFSLYVNMETLDLDDFRTPGEFTIKPIDRKSVTASMGGEILLRSKNVRMGNAIGEHLHIKGLFSDRKFNVSEFKMNAFDGSIDLHGSIDLSGSVPHVYVNGRLQRTKSGLFMQAFNAKTYIADGRSNMYGHFDSKGNTLTEMIRDVNGDIAVYSRNGRILKWNILSKIFGLLNIYDSLRGKAELTKEGLSYTRMGATFTAKNGIFTTKDFLIDSPSMVITGDGSLDIKQNEIDGNIAVSPLVTLDRTIDKIPILRNILREKDKGFLFAAYKVKGPVDDPDISVSFVKSIGGRAVEILKNILVLPKELLEGN